MSDNLQNTTQAAGSEAFDLHYEPVESVNPLELLGNAALALHHHMAPADGAYNLEGSEIE